MKLTPGLMMTIGDRAFVWTAATDTRPSILAALDKDGQRMLASIRAGLPEGESRQDVIDAAISLGKRRGEPVSVISSVGTKAVR